VALAIFRGTIGVLVRKRELCLCSDEYHICQYHHQNRQFGNGRWAHSFHILPYEKVSIRHVTSGNFGLM
jgi:hypothetical protein